MQRQRIFVALAALAALVVAVLFGLMTGFTASRLLPGGAGQPAIRDTATLLRQVQSLAQLVTVKYLLEKVVILEDVKWFGENRLIMVAHGVAKAGFDLSTLQSGDISVEGDHLKIRLPRPQITDVYIDDRRTEIVERSTGLLRAYDKDLELDARRQALDKIKLAAADSGIFKDAEERARLQLTLLGGQMGFSDVQVEVRAR
ncbi:MAG: DUF4230 domain-containing protein [Pedosphaera sp.]|nr:DUF4230 domain-containing protein [Pedosphaera sp.]